MLDGDKVRAACERRGINYAQLAQLLGVKRSTVSKIVGNNYPGMKLEMAQRLAWSVREHLCALLREQDKERTHAQKGPTDPS